MTFRENFKRTHGRSRRILFEVDASFIDGSLTLSYGDESDVYIGFDASELSKIMVELQSRLDHRADQS